MNSVIKYPNMTEKAMDDLDFQNKLQFVVAGDASKPEIADAVSEQFDVTVVNVTTQVQPDGEKKAYVELSEDDEAEDVASRIGVF
ncbi:50S ribosomal protein L23 [Halosimplex litoreum]|jgi:large subunit ribosomal protein L23|uniref:Large ribosomal subunit protein uL23 n=1 Tax=Halosimplex litoreum TaxID=1198301 RepID=A0A7T3KVG7_9EURY|nr:50S ribosomal protein L23 [Halosimplex litoreum]QPV63267.1 50S ribosomal protein L23 [Halosimplex litoreum]